MTATIEMLAARRHRSYERLEEASAKVKRADSPVLALQTEWEQSLADFLHYRTGYGEVVDELRNGGPYSPSSRWSFIADVRDNIDPAARQRLRTSARGVEAVAALEGRAVATSGFAGLVVPQYLTNLAAASVHSSAPVFAYLRTDLPDAGMSVVVPTWTTAHAGEAQASENTAATTNAIAMSSATAVLKTYETRCDVSHQVVDRTPGIDAAIAPDQIAAVSAKVEADLLNADGSGGTVLGLLNVASTTGQTYTDASPTGGELLHEIEKAYRSSVAVRGYPSRMVAIMATRRWSFLREKCATEGLTAGFNTSNNPAAVARYGDIDVVATPAMPTNISTTQDAVVVLPADVAYVGASPVTMEVTSATSGGALTSTITTRQYVASTLGRGLPSAIVVISGSGLTTP